MKTLAVLAVGAALLAGGADAATTATSTTTNVVTVTGTGSAIAVPDQASFAFTVQTKASTAVAAMTKNGTDTRAVVTAVEGAGVPAASVQTAQVSLDPVMSNDGTSIVAFTATDTISVAEVAIAKAGAIVDAAVAAGATSVSGPSLAIASQDALYAKALKAAVEQAKTKAQALADAAGQTLGPIQTMSEGGGQVPIPFAKSATDTSGGTPIEAGTQEIDATVTVTFGLGG